MSYDPLRIAEQRAEMERSQGDALRNRRDNADHAHEEALSLLREINGGWPQCPVCGVVRGHEYDPLLDDGPFDGTVAEWLAAVRAANEAAPGDLNHMPGCRLAALLGRTP